MYMSSNLPPGVSEMDPHFDVAPMFQDKDGTEVFIGDKVIVKAQIGEKVYDLIGEFINFYQGEVDLDENGNQSWIPDVFVIMIGRKSLSFECEFIDDDDYDILRCDTIERF